MKHARLPPPPLGPEGLPPLLLVLVLPQSSVFVALGVDLVFEVELLAQESAAAPQSSAPDVELGVARGVVALVALDDQESAAAPQSSPAELLVVPPRGVVEAAGVLRGVVALLALDAHASAADPQSSAAELLDVVPPRGVVDAEGAAGGSLVMPQSSTGWLVLAGVVLLLDRGVPLPLSPPELPLGQSLDIWPS